MKKILSVAIFIMAFQIAHGQANQTPTVNTTITGGNNIKVPVTAVDVQAVLNYKDSINQVMINKTILFERNECFKSTIIYRKIIDSLIKLKAKNKKKPYSVNQAMINRI